MNHTAGPWSIVQDAPLNPKSRYSIGSRQPNGCAIYVCTIRTERGLILDGKETANARLIAAAPELLEACKKAMMMLECDLRLRQTMAPNDNWHGGGTDQHDQNLSDMYWSRDAATIYAAIAKAEGRAT